MTCSKNEKSPTTHILKHCIWDQGIPYPVYSQHMEMIMMKNNVLVFSLMTPIPI
ncbi:hypothetical protein DAI22_08g143400 [Oryza sativa Japonica Group]|nr:hypothetical protein DAI22_08g143400 [Oryza sativa Japonica Group]